MSCCPCCVTARSCALDGCPCRRDEATLTVGEVVAVEPVTYSILLFKGKKKAKRFRRDTCHGVYGDTRTAMWGRSTKTATRWVIIEEAREFDEAIDIPGVHELLTHVLEYRVLGRRKLAMEILGIAIKLGVEGFEARASE